MKTEPTMPCRSPVSDIWPRTVDKSHENNGSGTHQSFAFTLGWLNKFRISPSFDFNIELKGLIAPSRVSPRCDGRSYLFGFSATAGFHLPL